MGAVLGSRKILWSQDLIGGSSVGSLNKSENSSNNFSNVSVRVGVGVGVACIVCNWGNISSCMPCKVMILPSLLKCIVKVLKFHRIGPSILSQLTPSTSCNPSIEKTKNSTEEVSLSICIF